MFTRYSLGKPKFGANVQVTSAPGEKPSSNKRLEYSDFKSSRNPSTRHCSPFNKSQSVLIMAVTYNDRHSCSYIVLCKCWLMGNTLNVTAKLLSWVGSLWTYNQDAKTNQVINRQYSPDIRPHCITFAVTIKAINNNHSHLKVKVLCGKHGHLRQTSDLLNKKRPTVKAGHKFHDGVNIKNN